MKTTRNQMFAAVYSYVANHKIIAAVTSLAILIVGLLLLQAITGTASSVFDQKYAETARMCVALADTNPEAAASLLADEMYYEHRILETVIEMSPADQEKYAKVRKLAEEIAEKRKQDRQDYLPQSTADRVRNRAHETIRRFGVEPAQRPDQSDEWMANEDQTRERWAGGTASEPGASGPSFQWSEGSGGFQWERPGDVGAAAKTDSSRRADIKLVTKVRPGMTMAQVKAILGPPHKTFDVTEGMSGFDSVVYWDYNLDQEDFIHLAFSNGILELGGSGGWDIEKGLVGPLVDAIEQAKQQ